MAYHPKREALEIREHLLGDARRLVFLIGAGASMSVGIPGIEPLTERVEEAMEGGDAQTWGKLDNVLQGEPNIEDILNQVRAYRSILENTGREDIHDLGEEELARIDRTICKQISEIVAEEEPDEPELHRQFGQWISQASSHRDTTVELFTLNYDLLLERGLEEARTPYFDGFIGGVHPFFVHGAVDSLDWPAGLGGRALIGHTAVWKLHGSLNWFLKGDDETSVRLLGPPSAFRREGQAPDDDDGTDFGRQLIFPSQEKYEQSRRSPFLALHDRLRRLLLSKEVYLVIIGYSFSDEHVNEIIRNGFESNEKLAGLCLPYGYHPEEGEAAREASDAVFRWGERHPNLSIYGPQQACVGGVREPWEEFPDGDGNQAEDFPPFWEQPGQLSIGDFEQFVAFLRAFVAPGQTAPDVGGPEGDQVEAGEENPE